jgi:hypothetical protein
MITTIMKKIFISTKKWLKVAKMEIPTMATTYIVVVRRKINLV